MASSYWTNLSERRAKQSHNSPGDVQTADIPSAVTRASVGQRHVSLHLASPPIWVLWYLIFRERNNILHIMQYFALKLDDSSASVMWSCHLISNTNHHEHIIHELITPRASHLNSTELTKSSETPSRPLYGIGNIDVPLIQTKLGCMRFEVTWRFVQILCPACIL